MTLGIDAESYGRDAFFADVQSYIRFKTPVHPLTRLSDPSDPDGPLVRIDAAIERGDERKVSQELRLLACLIRASSREVERGLVERIRWIAEHQRDDAIADLQRTIERYVDDVQALLCALRRRRDALCVARGDLRELYHYVDEGVSVYLEGHLTKLVCTLDRLVPGRKELRTRLVACVTAEQVHRREAEYATVLGGAGQRRPPGVYVYRRSMLKKFMSSVLYLELQPEREGRRLSHVTASLAAGIAMLVSTTLAIWSQEVYGLNTFPFVVALVLGYMVKDRTKDWLKGYLSNKTTRWLADRRARILDPLAGVVVGRFRESLAFQRPERIPTEVWQYRHCDATSSIETENKREVVMRYVKDINLAGRLVDRRVTRASDITDIVRVDVSRFLTRMDDARQSIDVYDPTTDRVRAVSLPKQYHLNVVLVLRTDRGVAQMHRVRLVLDKNGIGRMEPVGNTASLGAAGHPVRHLGVAPQRA